MAAPVALREDFDALALRGLAKKTRDANQSRRLLSLAEIYDGGSRGLRASGYMEPFIAFCGSTC